MAYSSRRLRLSLPLLALSHRIGTATWLVQQILGAMTGCAHVGIPETVVFENEAGAVGKLTAIGVSARRRPDQRGPDARAVSD